MRGVLERGELGLSPSVPCVKTWRGEVRMVENGMEMLV